VTARADPGQVVRPSCAFDSVAVVYCDVHPS